MEFTITPTKQDYWAYNKYSIFHVWPIFRVFILPPVLIFVIAMGAGLILHLDMRVITAVAVLLPLFYVARIFYPMYKGVMQIRPEHLQEQLWKIDLEKKQIIITTDGNVRKYNKSNIYKMKNTGKYIFLTMMTFSGLAIPRSSEYSLDEIMEALEKIV